MIAKSHFINYPREMYQEAEPVGRVGNTRISQTSSTSRGEAAKIRQQVPPERRLHSRFAYRNENAGQLDPAGNLLPVKAKARLVIQGQHCPDNAQGFVRTDAPTVNRTAVSVFLQLVSSMGWCRSLRGVDVSCAFLRGKPREVEEPLFFEPPSRGPLTWNRERCLGRNCEGCFWTTRFSPGDGGKNCVTLSKETAGHLSNWTLPSSACVTVLDISLE